MRHRNEFFGQATYDIIQDHDNNSKISWVIKNPELTLGHTRQIDEGDYLEIVDNFGNLKLQKVIYHDTESYYNPTHRRQLYNGACIAWAPRGVALDYWIGLFNNRFRAKLIKAEDLEE